MGTDINIYPECGFSHDGEIRWTSICGAFEMSRNRELFQRIGLTSYNVPDQPVVSPLFPLRGLPPALGYEAQRQAFISVDGDWRSDYLVTPAEANRMVASGKARWFDEQQDAITDPDLHGHTWLSCEEYRSVLTPEDEHINVDWWGLLAMLEEFERRGHTTRLVIWFDS